jgi:hypothetical protein
MFKKQINLLFGKSLGKKGWTPLNINRFSRCGCSIQSYILKQQWCLSVWAMPGKFFQSFPVPCGASPDVTSLDVTDSREKRNQGQSDFLRQKIW